MRPLLAFGLGATLCAHALLATAVAARLGGDSVPAGTAVDSPSLAGSWALNRDLSEDARAKMQQAMGAQRPEGAGGGFGGHGGHGGPGGGGFGGGGRSHGGAPPDGSATEPGRSGALRTFFEPPARLSITQSAAELSLDAGDAGTTVIRPDGKKVKDEHGETSAHWNGGELVVETKTERGATLTSAYLAAPGKHQLYVTSRLDRRGQAVTVRRVYDEAR